MVSVNGEWVLPASSEVIVDPLNGSPFLRLPDTKESELQPFVDSLRTCPKSGLHNPIKVTLIGMPLPISNQRYTVQSRLYRSESHVACLCYSQIRHIR
jgi:hypothetical protein